MADTDTNSASLDDHPSSGGSNRSRLSLTEVFEKMLAEESEEMERHEQDERIRRERWIEGRLETASYSNRRSRVSLPSLEAEDSEHDAPADAGVASIPGTPERTMDRASGSTSPQYSPPARMKRFAESNYPMESTQYPIHTATRTLRAPNHSLSLPSDDFLQPAPVLLEAQPSETSRPKPQAPRARDERVRGTVHVETAPQGQVRMPEPELWNLVHLMKEVLRAPDVEETKHADDISLSHMLHTVESELNKKLAQKDGSFMTLPAELQLDQLNASDAEYAGRLNVIRQRLGKLALDMTQTITTEQVTEHGPRGEEFSRWYNLFFAALGLIGILALFRLAQYRADTGSVASERALQRSVCDAFQLCGR
ncbi:hypothetical protein MVES_003437 [Malassezia vespertilionis]|uniref:Uncharacterized protein n=1 Tax=Malassezia vespertilionis TaxID=2020962 RepID=A0A2N1J7P1_9BASI|nr:hypothetical protein MVES_003437 [Malassezia vespertilionis]